MVLHGDGGDLVCTPALGRPSRDIRCCPGVLQKAVHHPPLCLVSAAGVLLPQQTPQRLSVFGNPDKVP